MGIRLPFFGFIRQFQADIRTLISRGRSRRVTIVQRLIALDRIAGTAVIICAAAMLGAFVASHANLLEVPSAMASSAYKAAFGQPAPSPADAVLLDRPMTSRDIRQLQRSLKQLGFDPGAIDGVAGRRTLEALNRYRQSKQLARVVRVDRMAAVDLLE